MKKIFGIVFLSLFLVGCTDYEHEPSVGCECPEYLGEKFVQINIPDGPIISEVRCISHDDIGDIINTTYFNHTWIHYVDKETKSVVSEGIRYNIRTYYFREGADIFDNKEFGDFLYDNNTEDIQCKSYLITNKNNIIIETWDEGYKEERKLTVYGPIEVLCFKSFGVDNYGQFPIWECMFEFNFNEYGDVTYMISDIENEIIDEAIE